MHRPRDIANPHFARGMEWATSPDRKPGFGQHLLDTVDSSLANIDPENFNPGYLRRGLHLLPRQGDRAPWRHTQDYWSEKDVLPAADLDDGSLVYG